MEYIDFSDHRQRKLWLEKFSECYKHVDLSWNTANAGLIERMRHAIIGQQSSSSSNTEEDKAFNDNERIDNLFGSKHNVNDVHAKHFLLNSVLNEFRKQKERLSPETIDKMMRRFCYDEFKDIATHRKDMYIFIEDLLLLRPPVNTRQRWDWICIITSNFGPDYDNEVVVRILHDFGTSAYKFMKENQRPHEFKLFLLNLLEYDYAALIVRQNLSRKIGEQLKQDVDKQQENLKPHIKKALRHQSSTMLKLLPNYKPRTLQLNKFEDFDQYPLAYLLLCQFSIDIYSFTEMGSNRLTNHIMDLVTKFDPKEDPPEISRPYARLIGLLLEVLLYVERGGETVMHDVKDVTQKVQNLFRKIKQQHDEGNADSFEWRTFLDMARLPWLRELDQMIKTSGRGRKSGCSSHFAIFNPTQSSSHK